MPYLITLCDDERKSGKHWILFENFHEETNRGYILKLHSRLNQTFHPDYRLFLITKECIRVK
jgi:hypothetical protein